MSEPTDLQVAAALRAACLRDTPRSRKDMRAALVAAGVVAPAGHDERAAAVKALFNAVDELMSASGAIGIAQARHMDKAVDRLEAARERVRTAMFEHAPKLL